MQEEEEKRPQAQVVSQEGEGMSWGEWVTCGSPEWVLISPQRDRDGKLGASDRMAVIDQHYFTNLPKFQRKYKRRITPCILIENLISKRKKII